MQSRATLHVEPLRAGGWSVLIRELPARQERSLSEAALGRIADSPQAAFPLFLRGLLEEQGMVRYARLVGLVAASAMGFEHAARAEAVAPNRPFVVIVGAGRFADKAIQPRPSADADARALGRVFADPRFAEVGPERTLVLTAAPDEKAGERKATRPNIVEALRQAVAGTEKHGTIVFAYFGRGASFGDNTCLFTAETVFKDRARTGLLGLDLQPLLRSARDRKLCLLLDVSFQGFDAGGEAVAEPTLRDLLAGLLGSDGERRGGWQPPNKVLFLASPPGRPPLARGDRGLFAPVLLDALKGDADVEGGEADGLVTVDELGAFLEKQLAEGARDGGSVSTERGAAPFVVGKESSHFPLTRNPKAWARVGARLKALTALEKEGKLTKDEADEARALVSRMPKEPGLRNLRTMCNTLADAATADSLNTFRVGRNNLKEKWKLPDEEAAAFARAVLRGASTTRLDYVQEIPTGEWVAMALRGLHRRLEVPLPGDVEAALTNAKDLSSEKAHDLLRDARGRLGRREDLANGKDVEAALQMMFEELGDPDSTYFGKEEIKALDAPLRGEFRGVGISLRRDLMRNGLLVTTPIKDSPAYHAGLKAGDLITEFRRDVNPQGEPLRAGEPKVLSTKGMTMDQALDVVLGKIGVPITLVVRRDFPDGKSETKEYTVRRGLVSMETVLGVKRNDKDEWDYYLDEGRKIGYVRLTQFGPSTPRDLVRALEQLRRGGLRGLVLDLRFNGGGLLYVAAQVTNLFIDQGVIVRATPRLGEAEVWRADGARVNAQTSRQVRRFLGRGGKAYDGFPMAILVNGNSVAASEIVAAALQDHRRVTVIGERTSGKGSVQSVKEFPRTGGQIKLTTARYVSPKGRNIDRLSTPGSDSNEWGVVPDMGFEVNLSREQHLALLGHLLESEIIPNRDLPARLKKPIDPQLARALEHLRAR